MPSPLDNASVNNPQYFKLPRRKVGEHINGRFSSRWESNVHKPVVMSWWKREEMRETCINTNDLEIH